jgi:hypothetical protein
MVTVSPGGAAMSMRGFWTKRIDEKAVIFERWRFFLPIDEEETIMMWQAHFLEALCIPI